MPTSLYYLNIRRIYEKCTWKQGDLDGLRQTVVGVEEKKHYFHERRLRSYRRKLANMLVKYMPDSLMRTKGSRWMPWYALGMDKDGIRFAGNEVVEQLVALTVGLELVSLSIRRVEGVLDAVAYVIIEDGKIRFCQRSEEAARLRKYHERKKQL